MTEGLYNKFKTKLANARPHTPEMKDFKKLLGEWLCSYHEVKMIDAARREAERRGGVLIYRDINGTFSLTPPIDSVNRNTNLITPEIKTPVKEKQKKRSSLSPQKSSIEPIENKESIEDIIGLMKGVQINTEEASIFVAGNNKLSMPLSLLLNAVRESRYLALEHYLKIDIFRQELNKTFNTSRFHNATLLHLAILKNDIQSVRLLLTDPNIKFNFTAEANINDSYHGSIHYENITPLQLAIREGYKEIVLLLLEKPQISTDQVVDYVVNGLKVGANNCLHLAAEQNALEIVEALLAKKVPLNAPNTLGQTPLDLALEKKHYLLAARLIGSGAESSRLIPHLKTINFEFRAFIQNAKNPNNTKNIPADLFEFLCLLKQKNMELLTEDEEYNYEQNNKELVVPRMR